MSGKKFVRWVVSPLTMAGLIFTAGLGGLTFQVMEAASAGRDERPSGSATTYTADAFYADVRDAFSTLFTPAKALGRFTDELLAGATPDQSVAGSAQAWEKDLVTAEDRVGRLAVPTVEGGRAAWTAYRLGAALYVEAARAVPRAITAQEPTARQEAGKAMGRLQALGDRTFDVGTRLLRAGKGDWADGIDQRIPTPEVPNFSQHGLQASGSALGPGVPTPVGGQAKPIPPSEWRSGHQGSIDRVAAILAQSRADDVASAVAELERATDELKDDVPDSLVGREGAHALRLSFLVGAESFRTPQQAQRLRVIADQLWDFAAGLLDLNRGH